MAGSCPVWVCVVWGGNAWHELGNGAISIQCHDTQWAHQGDALWAPESASCLCVIVMCSLPRVVGEGWRAPGRWVYEI